MTCAEVNIWFRSSCTEVILPAVDSVLQTEFRPDILTNHVDWSSEILKVMPNSKQITIVRDPIQQFISAFEYYHKSGKEFE